MAVLYSAHREGAADLCLLPVLRHSSVQRHIYAVRAAREHVDVKMTLMSASGQRGLSSSCTPKERE